ncbi:hypothetical protein N7512_005780 [Penicillium capsulatum]|nr:hypothetical protein N7512_005780 [Penicillium capsulatum]
MYQNEDVTTYLVTCSTPADTGTYDAPRERITVIAAPSSIQLINIDKRQNTASVSCDVVGTTYAYCHAQEKTVSIQGTLAPNDLNWMNVPVTEYEHTPTPTQLSTLASKYTGPPVLSGTIEDISFVTGITTAFLEKVWWLLYSMAIFVAYGIWKRQLLRST